MWDCFKVTPQPNTATLVEAIRTMYSPNFVPVFSSNTKIAVNVLEVEEVTFILVSNKKYKRKSKVFFFSSIIIQVLE